MAVTTKKLFPATSNATTTVFSPVGIQLNNQDDLDVYVTLSGGTRVLQLRQSTGSTAQSSHPQVNNTDGLYFPAVSAGTTLYNYQLSTDNNTITFNSALPQGAVVFCERRTRDADSSYTSFASGSTIRATDLNNSSTESNFTAQDGRNKALTIEGVLFRGDQPSTNFITTDHIVNGSIITTDIANDSVTADKIPDDTINSEHYVDLSIDTQHIANENITTAKLANSAVTTSKLADLNVTRGKLEADIIDGTKLADNAVDSEHYTDGSIDRVHLEADIIDSTKLADNAVNTEHYVDGSIQRVHLEADIIDSSKLADNSVNSEHYVDGSIDRVHLAADIVDGTKIADDSINSEHYVDGSIDHAHLANDIIDGDNIQDDVVNSEHIAAGALDNEHYAAGSITSDKLNGSTVITSSEQASATTNDTSFLTSAAADARFFNISSGDTIKDGDTFPDNDTTIATTAAINDRIIDLVEEVGGFVPIANETSFPTANPDINNSTGTLVSIKSISSTRTPNSGTVTIANGAGSGNTVSITGCGSTVLTAGFGVIVETTSTLHTYTFHRLVPKATEVSTVAANATNIAAAGANTANINSVVANASNVNTVAGNISNVNTVGGISANVTTVAGIAANVTTVANNNANVTAVAGNNSNITDVADNETNINAVKNNETNINAVANNNSNITAVANNASNINSAVSNASNINSAVSNASNINSAVSNASNINTVAGSISNVNTTAGSIANVNTVASNISNVNSFAGTYQIASSAPTTDGAGNALAEGDLYFDTSSDELRVYNGTSWQGGVTAGTGFASSGTNTFTGNQTIQNTQPTLFLTDTNDNPDFEIRNQNGKFVIRDSTNGANRLNINSDGHIDLKTNVDCEAGLDVTGNITVSGNVDGRDVSADGTKLDGIESGATADQTASEILSLISNQAISTTGTGSTFGRLTISNVNPFITLTDTNNDSDFSIRGASGNFVIRDDTNAASRLTIASNGTVDIDGHLDANNGLDVTGNITTTGTVQLNTTVPSIEFNATSHENDFRIINYQGNFIVQDTDATANRLEIASDGTVNFLNNVNANSGLDVTGNITVTGTVDGRDVASDGSKLDGIESGATADQSASEILTLIKTVDGSGSGLDADTLDGISSASFVRSDASDTLTGNEYTFNSSSDQKIILSGSSNPYIRFKEGTTNKAYIQWNSNGHLYLANQESGEKLLIGSGTNGLIYEDGGNNNTVWHSGNDGSGSGLDADVLDGLNSSQFLRSDTSDTMSGQLNLSTSTNQKLILQGSSDPYIHFREGTTDKAYIQWHSNGNLYLVNQESGESLLIGSGSNGLKYLDNGSSKTVWHSGNDGSGSGLDADTVDGIQATNFLRSDQNDTASGDITFSGGAGAVSIAGNSDIRFSNGTWSGNATKIQHYASYLYIQGGSNGIVFRHSDGNDRWFIDGSGHLDPILDSTYDIGQNDKRVRNGYFDTLYGDGSNLTGIQSDPTIANGCIYENEDVISSTVSTTSGKNAMSAGPIQITGTLTVADNTTYTIV